MIHKPVLLKEVIHFLDPQPNQHFIDATLGEGGHARALLERTSPSGVILGIEKDIQQIERAKKEFSSFEKRVMLVHDSFGNLGSLIKANNLWNGMQWQGILFDLGWSSRQMEESGRGFSFLRDEVLDMRYGLTSAISYKLPATSLTAKDIVNKWSKEDIEKILREYGEERFAKRIAETIVKTRRQKPIETTFQLVHIITSATPPWYHHRRIPRRKPFGLLRGRHPATKTFQALRIAVNDEWKELEKGLKEAPEIITKKGKIVVISFHSGEDRIVKQVFRSFRKEGYGTLLTKKPLRPSLEEQKINPRSRSAKLRAIELI